MYRGVAAAVLAAAAAGLLGSPVEAQSWRTVTSTRQLQGEKRLDVQVEYGAGSLSVSPGDASQLYGFELRYDEDQFAPVAVYQRDTGVLRLGTESRDKGRGSTTRGGKEAHARIQLSPAVPTALTLKFGAGEARLGLGALSLQSVDISTGASETVVAFDAPNRVPAEFVRLRSGAAALRASGLGNANAERFEVEGGVGETVLDFGGTWTRNASASVKMGMGSITLRFPRSLGVRLSRSSFLTSFDSEGLTKRGDAHYSPNWDGAAHRLTVHVNAALGAIRVEWID